MNTSRTILVLLLCIGAANAFEIVTYGDRQPGDRPIYIQTLESNEIDPEFGLPYVNYTWLAVNQTFAKIYLESSPYSWVSMNQEGDYHPLYERSVDIRVASINSSEITVSFIVFGFINQPPTHPGTEWPISFATERKLIEIKTNVAG